jgi:molecular chaperone DnaK
MRWGWGIDFGTTNTAVGHMAENNEPEVFELGEAQQNLRYMPSLTAVRHDRGDRRYYGQEAKTLIGQPHVTSYHNFKMLLAEPPAKVSQAWAGAPADPKDITEDFIGQLMSRLREQTGRPPNFIVVTIPEVWLRQGLLNKRDLLLGAFKRLGIKKVRAESEPVAAAVYYLHCFKKKKGRDFSGHLLVCDCGGGTLDFCLVRASAEEGLPIIEVLERAGNGLVGNYIGGAGVAFDHGVVERLFPQISGEEFYRKVREFENFKIQTSDIRGTLQAYLQSPDTVSGQCIFSLDATPVTPEDLVTVFEQRVRPGLDKALADLKSKLAPHGVAEHDPDHFRVLLVGGFSAFHLVQEAVKSAFGSLTDVDARFEDIFTVPDRALAIAKGAALIAGGRAQTLQTCPADVGVSSTFYLDYAAEERRIILLKRGERISAYREPVWHDKSFNLGRTDGTIPCFFEPVPGRYQWLRPQGTLASVLPPGLSSESKVRVGFSIDEDMVVYVHFCDPAQPDNTRRTSLGDLLEKIPQGLVLDA